MPRQRSVNILCAALLPALAPGCGTPKFAGDALAPRGTRPPVASAEAIEDGDARSLPMFAGDRGFAMGWADLMDAVAWADAVIVGEQHDDGTGHAFQRALVEDVCTRRRRSALSLEMLERDEQEIVDDYAEGIIDADGLLKLTFSEGWGGKEGRWEDWYQKTIDAALAHGASVVAANAPRRYVRLARTSGYERLAALPPERRRWVDVPRGAPAGDYRRRFDEIMTPAEGDEGSDEGSDEEDDGQQDAGDSAEPSAGGADDRTRDHDARDDAPASDAPVSDAPVSDAPMSDAPATDTPATTAPAHAAPPTTAPAHATPATTAPAAAAMEPAPAPPAAPTTASAAGPGVEAAPAPPDERDDPAPAHSHVPTAAELDALFRSQRVWDATMARSIARAAGHGSGKVVHLVGQFHCDFDGGLVQELRRRLPGGRILVISLRPEDADRLRDEDRGRADVIVYTGARSATGDR